VQVIDVVRQVKQFGSHVLQILLSLESPYSLLLAQEISQVLVTLFPQVGAGHCVTQVDPLKNLGELQLVQVIAVP
jgi:hypothetical protein